MSQAISRITLVVNEYQEAISYFTEKLGFELIEDTWLSSSKRWVVVAPKASDGCQLLLAKAANQTQTKAVGNQTGGRVFLFLRTDNFWQDYESMKQAGVQFTEHPREESYGTVVVFEDLYGNLWDLVQPKE